MGRWPQEIKEQKSDRLVVGWQQTHHRKHQLGNILRHTYHPAEVNFDWCFGASAP